MCERYEGCNEMSQLMRLWYLSHRQAVKAQANLRICAISPEPSLFTHMKYGSIDEGHRSKAPGHSERERKMDK